MNSNYDNELYKEEDLRKIILEFSRYKTFRGWIINKMSPKTKKTSQNVIIKKSLTRLFATLLHPIFTLA